MRTEEMEFEVVGDENNHLWLRVLHGPDKGMRVSVPVRHPGYEDDELTTLSSVGHGDILTATLVSDDEEYPNWRVSSVSRTPAGSAVTSPSETD